MTNPYPHGSSGANPPPYTSSPGAGSAAARRSSYASVLSGTAPASIPVGNSQSLRSGFFSQQAGNHASQPAQSQAAHIHHASLPNPRSLELSQSYNESNRPANPWDVGQPPRRASSFGHWGGEGLGGSIMDARNPDFFIPSYMRGLRHVERLEEKHKARIAAQRDNGKSGRSSNGGSLSTSASGMFYHEMVPSHRGMTYEIQEKHVSDHEESLSPLPTRWSQTDKSSGLELSLDGTEVKFTGQIKSPNEAPAIRSDHPMPRECGIYYFEVTVLGKGKEGLIAVGFSNSEVSLNRIPGWEEGSWAYHGDDGSSYAQNSAAGKIYGPKYASSDVVGCGVNFKTKSAFFTKNGINLGTAFKDINVEKLYPSIGIKKTGEHIKVNFGQSPFVYDIDGRVARERELLSREIEKEENIPTKNSKSQYSLLQDLVAQYLAHDGYTETAKAFADEVRTTSTLLRGPQGASSVPEYREDLDAIHRQQIRAAILEGNVDKALKHTSAYYPSVLQDNENIYFKLRCRKFIEMIKRSTELQSRTKRQSSNNSIPTVKTFTNGHTYLQGSKPVLHDDFDVFDSRMDLDNNYTAGVAVEDDSMDLEDSDVYTKQNNLMNDALQYGRELQAEFKDDPRREVKQALEDTFALIAYPDARESSLAPLLENTGRVPVAEELNCAILVSLGQSSTAALERLVQQTEVLVEDISADGGGAALINVKNHYLR